MKATNKRIKLLFCLPMAVYEINANGIFFWISKANILDRVILEVFEGTYKKRTVYEKFVNLKQNIQTSIMNKNNNDKKIMNNTTNNKNKMNKKTIFVEINQNLFETDNIDKFMDFINKNVFENVDTSEINKNKGNIVYWKDVEDVINDAIEMYKKYIEDENVDKNRKTEVMIMIWYPPSLPVEISPYEIFKKRFNVSPEDMHKSIIYGEPISWKEQIKYIPEYYKMIERKQLEEIEELIEIGKKVNNIVKDDIISNIDDVINFCRVKF